MPGQLFTQYFLTDGIQQTAEWQVSVEQPEAFAGFKAAVSERFESFSHYTNANESVTEQDLIRPILELLGWVDYLPQQGTSRNEDIPDHLLFEDAGSKTHAVARTNSEERYRDAVVVEESKRFGLVLDNRDATDRVQANTPHGQIQRYLSTAETVSDGRIRWGILTNGDTWRLYDHRARPRLTGYFGVDLGSVLKSGDEDTLRIFYLLFRRDAFTPQEGVTATFIDSAIDEGRRYEEQVAQDLSGVVFGQVFPALINEIARQTDADLTEVRDAALIFLYRLLFVLYAEDRGLLPVNDSRYADYGLRLRVRDDVARKIRDGNTFSTTFANYYDRLSSLFRAIDVGDASIGLPPYNGGLFAAESAPLLVAVSLSDAVVAPIVYELSHTDVGRLEEGPRRFVNYRDMSVQQLGSIYERLLEREPVREEDGSISVRLNPYARKDSGSFYTPQPLVDLIVDQTLKPLAEERLAAFESESKRLAGDRRPKTQRLADLAKLDPAEAVLDLKVLDPAMGSGHFLVTAVDFLADYIAELIEHAPVVPEWLDETYQSPLVGRVANIRSELVSRAQQSNWILDGSELTDQAIIRRMILKRCIYGVDKNPLTVELAKVSLWLHSFTVGAPLSFLDHHLRCGDSLIGLHVTSARDQLLSLGGLSASSAIQGAENATVGMERIEQMSDADISEVQESFDLFQGVEKTTADLRAVLDFLCGLDWLEAGMKKREKDSFEAPLKDRLDANPQDAYRLLADGRPPEHAGGESGRELNETPFDRVWEDARSVANRERFLHWEVAFPGVWHHWENVKPQGGFDAVIGNPPWDRIKLQEVEWFATRAPELALAPTAAARRAAIRELRENQDPLADVFDEAKARADGLGQLVRRSGDYPLLGGGDINLYSLFVERAMNLIKPDGIVGLLTPSGIYADRTAAKFFKSVSTTSRVAGIYDFENRRLGTGLPPYFPDVDSRFKFCALIFGGESRKFEETRCAFFLHDTETINDPDRCFPLAPEDFARVNPNTGTAPVFRTSRDAEITRRIYENHPVLVDRSDGTDRRVWPVRYNRMFDMTNDSHLFRTAAQLESEGFYPVEGNRWQKGDVLYLPLHEGKMVQAFDHRAAGVEINAANLSRPAQPRSATYDEHVDPAWQPSPQFWVDLAEIEWPADSGWAVSFKDVTSPTNVRTMIAAVGPRSAYGNTLPLLISPPDSVAEYRGNAGVWVACLNSFVLDFMARQKVQGQHLNWFVVEQLPVIVPADYDRQFGNRSARELVRDHVLRLTYTAHDMKPFAKDLGYDGEPFIWNGEERRHLRARLDALYFILYGIDREDAAYILDTFPIVRRQDEAEFGSYRTKEMVLAYMNALAAGDTETDVAV